MADIINEASKDNVNPTNENINKSGGFPVIWVVLAVVVLLAAFFMNQPGTTHTTNPEISKIQSMFLDALVKGQTAGNYYYQYSEVINGYKIETTLIRNDSERYLGQTNVLFSKKAYFLGNQTIICSKALFKKEGCVVPENDSAVNQHVDSLRSLFSNFENPEKIRNDVQFLINKGVVVFDPETSDKTVANVSCTQIKYVLDYSNLTLSDAAALGIGQNSPKVFHATACISEDGVIYEKSFLYTFNGKEQDQLWQLEKVQLNSDQIIADLENITENVSAYNLLSLESDLNSQLSNCYNGYTGVERDKCLSTMAVSMDYPPLCSSAGTRSDSCYLNLVSLHKDVSLCTQISGVASKDDCYIEIAGFLKTPEQCSNVANETKKAYCMNVSTSIDVLPEPSIGNSISNSSVNSSADSNSTKKEIPDWIQKILEEDS